jgi:hypothetical protein
MTNDNICTQLNGEYLNKGEFSYSPKGGSEYLAYRFGFNLDSLKNLDSIHSLKVSCANGNALLIGLDYDRSSSSIKTVTSSSDGWHFESGTLILPIIKNAVGDGFGGYSARERFQIFVGSDGSLIGKQTTSSVGLALWIIPVGGSQTFWFRWQKLPQE